jgi:hypothetical protein
MEIAGTDVADTINVKSLNANQTLVVRAGKGNDTIYVGDNDLDAPTSTARLTSMARRATTRSSSPTSTTPATMRID